MWKVKFVLIRIKSFLVWLWLKLINPNIKMKKSFTTDLKGTIKIRGEHGQIILGEKITIRDITFSFGHVPGSGLVCCENGSVFDDNCILAAREGTITIGKDVYIGNNVLIQTVYKTLIEIGDRTMIAKDTNIYASNHDHVGMDYYREYGKDIIIGKDVWIGANVTILAGISIGDFAVIGAGAVINKDIPAYTLWAGNPGKMIKKYDLTTKTWIRV